MSKTKWIIGLALALVIAYFVASPWITVYRMKTAVEQHDGAALAAHIDLPSVRQSLKDQINGRVKHQISGDANAADNPLAAFGTALAGLLVDKLVDATVTPAGISELMEGMAPQLPLPGAAAESPAQSAEGSAPKPLARASMGYAAWNRFVVTAKDRNGREQKFVLQRRGLDWKLTEVILALD